MNFSWRSSWKLFNYICSNYIPKYKYNEINKFYAFKMMNNRYSRFIISVSVLNCAVTEGLKLTEDCKTQKVPDEIIIVEHISNLENQTLNLIETLHKGLLEKGELYRQCVEHQIYLLTKGLNVSQDNTTLWDDLLESRSQAESLKKELTIYQDLIQYVGRAMENIILMSAVLGKETKEVFAYYELKNMAETEAKENKIIEAKLLRATMKNIARTKMSHDQFL